MRRPAFAFRPFSKRQKQAITWWMAQSPYADYDGVVADGAVRSGKTVAMIVGFVLWSTGSFAGENFIVSGKSIGTLKRNVVAPMCQILQALGIAYQYHRAENYLEFGGNTYYLFGANNEASQDVLQGLTAAGWLGDEVALHPQNFIEQAIARCSIDGSKYWLNCNPENPYHYVKTELIDKAIEKRLLHLHFTMDDNLTLSESVKARYRRMYAGVWFKRFVLGLWVAAEGAIYDMLDLSKHVIDDDKIPVGEIKLWFVAADYGTASVTTFWLLGLTDDCAYFVDCWRWDASRQSRQKTDLEFGKDLEQWLTEWKIVPRHLFIPDDAASFIQQLQRQRGSNAASVLRNLAVADRSPGSVLHGIRDISSLLGAGKLFFARRIDRKGGMDGWTSYVWDDKAMARGEDKPVKENDHDPDAGRYAIHGARAYWQKFLR